MATPALAVRDRRPAPSPSPGPSWSGTGAVQHRPRLRPPRRRARRVSGRTVWAWTQAVCGS